MSRARRQAGILDASPFDVAFKGVSAKREVPDATIMIDPEIIFISTGVAIVGLEYAWTLNLGSPGGAPDAARDDLPRSRGTCGAQRWGSWAGDSGRAGARRAQVVRQVAERRRACVFQDQAGRARTSSPSQASATEQAAEAAMRPSMGVFASITRVFSSAPAASKP